ncbi:CinA family protein [bacterium]|nr:CinA family protein [bacterium]
MLKMFFTKPEYKIAKILTQKGLIVSTAESCTGGLISSRLTDVSGSSAFIKENYVTYANEVKSKLLNVSQETLNTQGAVSEQCAREMAQGLFIQTKCDIALCITGIAGPTGGTPEKPVGTVFISIKNKDLLLVKKFNLNPRLKRTKMKYAFSQKALEFLLEFLKTI